MSNKKSASPKAKIVIISGPSGCGKTTLHKALLAEPRFKRKLVKSISATTRPKRPGERHGREYLFLNSEDFQEKIKKGYFFEWQKVFDQYYGTPKKQALALIKKGTNVLLCIDVKGARSVAAEFPQALKIFIKAPSMQILSRRLKSRGSETAESLGLRLKVARRELKEAKHYDHVIVNGDLKKALKRLEQIVCREVLEPAIV
ncbi:MAG: guanylate kinase [Candidatus Omnitrophica bacterium]|nr:guanylate kinase [Candidatus Omnitrophota bacterium]MDE2221670.1 guanylate kinase [Candidatus Omnitrophota bacterium]